jgi:hypothetical protein
MLVAQLVGEKRNGVRRRRAAALAVATVIIALYCGAATAVAQRGGTLSGTWVLDRDASQLPREIGFGADFVPTLRGDDTASAGGRGRRGQNGQSPALRPQGDSYDTAQRRERVTAEVRNPPARLTIVDLPDVVSLADDKGAVRTLHPSGRAETVDVSGSSVLVTSHREDNALVVLYAAADLRQIRYAYSRESGQSALTVDVQFIERGSVGDRVQLVYRPPVATPAAAPSGAAGHTDSTGGGSGSSVPAAMTLPRAGSEFTGLTRLGLVVEEPAAQAVGCGLTRDLLEAAASKPFTEAGLRVARNSDEDTYLYLSVMTSTLPTGMCISRYDWSIYSTTEATLSYQRRPLLAQVLLAHKGGLTGSMPAAHPADVIRGMTDGLTQIAAMIRDANKP